MRTVLSWTVAVVTIAAGLLSMSYGLTLAAMNSPGASDGVLILLRR